MKKLLLTTLMTISIVYAFGQQDKLLTHFIFDKMSLNPGATGIHLNHEVSGTFIYRDQWDKFSGAPNSTIFNAEANISRYFPSGVGISYYNDVIGFSNQNNLTVNYSYHLPLGDGLLGIGAALGFVSYGISPSWVTPDQNPNDALLPGEKSQMNIDANFGAYYRSYQGWYAGISTTHIPAVALDELNFNTARHYYAMGGYRLNEAFGVEPLDIEANGLLRTDFKLMSADINIRAIWQKMFYMGLTYRTFDAIAIMAGASWRGFTLGYSYDISANRISNVSQGSHEIMLRYIHPLPPILITKAHNPRFL